MADPKLDLAEESEFPQDKMAHQMRKAAALAREHGHEEIAQGNEAIAEYIEGLECGLAAERKLSKRRTEQRDAVLIKVKELEADIITLRNLVDEADQHAGACSRREQDALNSLIDEIHKREELQKELKKLKND